VPLLLRVPPLRDWVPATLRSRLHLVPLHVDAYNTFWVINGLIGVVAYAMLALLVHPRDEPLDRSCQCTRARTHRAHDERRRWEAEAEAATKSPTPLGLTRRLVASRALGSATQCCSHRSGMRTLMAACNSKVATLLPGLCSELFCECNITRARCTCTRA
jgi:hypothetical protein